MRRKNDAYHTPEWATRQLLNRIHIKGTVLEVCAGENHITNVLLATEADIYTNDIDNTHWHGYHFDAANLSAWPTRRFDWVVTNPPFNKAFDILVNSLASASNVALLLRLSFLEPTKERGATLAVTPPQGLIVLPRISFTNDGKTDSVTCAWMIWNNSMKPFISIACSI